MRVSAPNLFSTRTDIVCRIDQTHSGVGVPPAVRPSRRAIARGTHATAGGRFAPLSFGHAWTKSNARVPIRNGGRPASMEPKPQVASVNDDYAENLNSIGQ